MNQILQKLLIKHEGLRLKPYKDSVGKLTIGIGRNLDDNGISRSEALILLDHDIEQARHEAEKAFPWYAELNEIRKIVIISLIFNMGLTRTLGFKKALLAIKHKDYATAASEMLDSKWAKQVKGRAIELAAMMKTGEEGK